MGATAARYLADCRTHRAGGVHPARPHCIAGHQVAPIRLDIENRKEEIRVTQLIGATNAYSAARSSITVSGLGLYILAGY